MRLLSPVVLAFLPWVVVSGALCAPATPFSSQDELKKQGRERIQQFASQLKSELSQAIAEGGLVNGIMVCQQRAPQIAAALSSDNWTIGRTSLKSRNPDNQPDAWETSVLQAFESRLADKGDIGKLLETAVIDNKFRMMKAIPVGELCLACHGENVHKSTNEALLRYYPQDAATGYRTGQIRGAFTLTYSGTISLSAEPH